MDEHDGVHRKLPLVEIEYHISFAKPAQKPVAWMHVLDNTEGLKDNGTGIVSITQKQKHPFGKPKVDFDESFPVTSTPLYTTPPKREWVGLTEEQLNKLWLENSDEDYGYARAIEQALKEKNNGT